MKGTVILFLGLCMCCICWTNAAAVDGDGDAGQKVEFLKYRNDQELEEIQRQIIAQYENLGGSSQFHDVQSASFVDPQNIKINV